ncbi:fatty-acid amide hydrolase 1-like [Gigantopelta aegis]|uniref:fatty-acid amide hydrolase 1-like n=1 Tax=Gigantopelta aegis TaxID=1735272 RepID=UPI001B8889D6|nr:fatty-acid amide hydrolase 1-like [Gigantopelta aegis]
MWQHINLRESASKIEVPKWLPQYVAVAVGCGVAVHVVHRLWRKVALNRKLDEKKQQLKTSREKLVKEVQHYHLDPNLQKEIVHLSVEALQNRLQTGKLKAMDVLRAYQAEALLVDDRLNCISETLLEATDRACDCDSNKGQKGMLHGVPVSVKENYNIQGYDTTIGMEYFINKPADETAVLIQVLERQGAIPFVRTNVPQTMYSYSCSNPIYGVTKNPHDVARCPGGSSGGEAALIGGGGSLMGIGGDIGGSLRIPGNMCGIYALKPTYGRLSKKGMFSVGSGQTLVQGTPGPMGRDVDTIVMLQQALLSQDMFDLDPAVPPIPFRTEIYKDKSPLKIGFYTWDGGVQTVPSNVRAVQVAKAALERMGHTVVPYTPPRAMEAVATLWMKAMAGDGGQSFTEKLKDDYVDDAYRMVYILTNLPRMLVWLLSKLMYPLDPFMSASMKGLTEAGSVYDWFILSNKIQAYKEEYLQSWRSEGLNAVIAPVYPCPAVLLNKASFLTVAGSMCQLYNLLNYPSGVVPVTKVSADDLINLENPNVYSPRNLQEKVIKKACEGGEGLPISVQCVGLPFQEELVLRVMKDLETGLKTI